MKKLVALLSIGFFLVSNLSFAQSGTKFAVVNLQQALNEVNAGKTTKEKLSKEYETKSQAFEKEQEQLKTEFEALQGQKGVLSQEAMGEKMQGLQKRHLDIQTRYANFQREFKMSEAKSAEQIIRSLQEYVKELAQQKGYTMVLENSTQVVLFATDAPDLTDELIALFNKKGLKK